MSVKIECPRCGTNLDNLRNRNNFQRLKGSMLHCPQCNCNLNSTFKGFQNFLVLDQKLSIKLTPCDDSFKPSTDEEVEIFNKFIKDIDLTIFTYGFEGQVTVKLPIKHYVTKIFDFFTKRNPVKITISFEQTSALNDKVQQSLELEGIVESTGNKNIVQDFYAFDDVNVSDKDNYEINTYRTEFTLKFVDPLKYFFTKQALLSVNLNTTYQTLLGTHVSDCKADDFVTISVDSAFSALTSERDFIATPFQEYESDQNYYSFWVNTIREYGGYLLYQSDGSYKITNTLTQKAATFTDIHRHDKPFVSRIRIDHCERVNQGLTVFNGIHDEFLNKEIKTNNTTQSEANFTLSHVTKQDVNSLFNLEGSHLETALQNDNSREYCLDIFFNGIPFYTTMETYSQVKLKASQWLNMFGEEDLDRNIYKINIKMEMVASFTVYDRPETKDSFNDDDLKDLLSQKKEKTTAIYPFLQIATIISTENSDSKYQHLPEVAKSDFPVTVEGTIVVTDDVISKYDSEGATPYMIFNAGNQESADANTNKQDNTVDQFMLSRKPDNWMAYHVKLIAFTNGEETCIIPVPYCPNVQSDQHFAPYENDDPVKIALYQESAVLKGAADYTTFENIDKTMQMNQTLLGPEDQLEQSFKVDDDDQVYTITKTESDTNTVKKITMTNEGMTLSFEKTEE
ncbi:MAG: hypothetical protein GY750_05730 [Lentisphaerae bacterium]|nr:hypothetical protein [Lentisphaerota bacterium]MCP4100909.1 hypothetical protein [Lentisphaerota bacterium]